ncbi:hypothetical protein K1X76_00630 [bacterium]|nr:hypothetical protein [bacterium]
MATQGLTHGCYSAYECEKYFNTDCDPGNGLYSWSDGINFGGMNATQMTCIADYGLANSLPPSNSTENTDPDGDDGHSDYCVNMAVLGNSYVDTTCVDGGGAGCHSLESCKNIFNQACNPGGGTYSWQDGIDFASYTEEKLQCMANLALTTYSADLTANGNDGNGLNYNCFNNTLITDIGSACDPAAEGPGDGCNNATSCGNYFDSPDCSDDYPTGSVGYSFGYVEIATGSTEMATCVADFALATGGSNLYDDGDGNYCMTNDAFMNANCDGGGGGGGGGGDLEIIDFFVDYSGTHFGNIADVDTYAERLSFFPGNSSFTKIRAGTTAGNEGYDLDATTLSGHILLNLLSDDGATVIDTISGLTLSRDTDGGDNRSGQFNITGPTTLSAGKYMVQIVSGLLSDPAGYTVTTDGASTKAYFEVTSHVTISKKTATTTEAGGTDTFTVVLDQQPAADVVIDLSSDDTGEGTVSPASLTFTNGDWDTPQTVTVTGVDDGASDGNIKYHILTDVITSADGNFGGSDPADVVMSNTDDDAPSNTAPDAPSSLGAASYVDGSTVTDTTPTLTFTDQDDDNDSLTYQIQIDDTSDFSSPVVDYTSAAAAEGSKSFTVGQAEGGGTYAVGAQNQTLVGKSYYWRVRSNDGTDTSSWSTANSGSVAFVMNVNPSVTIDKNNATITEDQDGTTTSTITATLSAANGVDVTVNFGFSGTATGGNADYTLPDGSSCIVSAGDTTCTIRVVSVHEGSDENSETVIADVTSVNNGTESGTQQVTINITDFDDPPTIFNLQLTGGAGNGYYNEEADGEFGNHVTISAVLTAASGKGVTLHLNYPETFDGMVPELMAVRDEDYTADNGVDDSGDCIFLPNEATCSVTLTAIHDTIYEGYEGWAVVVGTAVNADSDYENTPFAAFIIDDDAEPSVEFTTTSSSGSESSTPAQLQLTLSKVVQHDTVVPYSILGGSTASAGLDFTAPSGTVTIPGGQTTANINITIADDDEVEANETIVVQLGDPDLAALDENDTHTYTITDNEAYVTIDQSAAGGLMTEAHVADDNPISDVITATLSKSINRDTTVHFSFSGTATGINGNYPDYTLPDGDFCVVGSGDTTCHITITRAEDTMDEDAETTIVDVASVENGIEDESGGPQRVTATIVADETDLPPTITLRETEVLVNESDLSKNIMIDLSGRSGKTITANIQILDYTYGDLAAEGYLYDGIEVGSFTGAITIDPEEISKAFTISNFHGQDSDPEPEEHISFALYNTTNATLAETDYASLVFVDDDTPPGYTVSAISGPTSEAGGTATFTVKLNSRPTANVVIPVSSSNTDEGTVSPATLTFTPGNWSTNQTVTVTGVDDDIVDVDHQYDIVLAQPTDSDDDDYAALNPADVEDVVNTDNDTYPTVSIAQNYPTITEELAGDITDTITATLSGTYGENVTVHFAFSGTATFTSDYTRPDGTSCIVAIGDTTCTIRITRAQDTTDEDDETVIVDVDSVDNGVEDESGGPQQVTATITDDDAAPTVQFHEARSSVLESAASKTITFDLSAASGKTVSLTYFMAVTSAAQAYDFLPGDSMEAYGGTLEFAPGETSKGFTINFPADNADPEPEREQIFTITATNNTSVSGIDSYTLYYIDNDNTPGYTVGGISGNTTEAGGTAIFNVHLNTQPTANVVIPVSSSNTDEGTVSPASLTFTSANWMNQQTVTVTGVDDEDADGNQNYSVILGTPSNSNDDDYKILDPDDVAVVNEDDETVPNTAPTAHAGDDQNVNDSAGTVNLDGSTSSDPENDTLSYAWTETADAGNNCTLSADNVASPNVTILNIKTNYNCTYELVVNDGTVDSSADAITIDVTGDDDAPTANANIDQTVNDSAGTVNLDGSTSSDPENDTLSYAWTETADAGNNCTLSADNVASPNVTILNKTGSYTCTYELVVNDGNSDSSADSMQISVTGDNDAPTANAGVDQNVNETAGTVNLDGSSSSDPEGQSITYLWTETADAAGGCSLAGGTTATPTVTISEKTSSYSCTYQLVVNDGTNNSAGDSMTISVTGDNDAPTANAGDDQNVNESAGTVNLDGSNSIDPEAQSVTFLWTETADAAGACSLAGGTTATPTVTIANKATNYSCTYQLVVNDGTNNSAGDSMTINVTADDDAPIAHAGNDQTPNENAVSVNLNGSTSSDPEGQSLTYLWTEETDASDSCAISGETTATPTVTFTERSSNYSCVYSLVVNDGTSDSASDSMTISITADNDPPTADAGPDQNVNESAGTVNLDGSNSIDPEAESVTFAWTETADAANACTLVGGTTATPTVTIANKATDYSCTYELVVDDGTTESAADEMVINVTADNDAPTAHAGIDQTVNDSVGTVSLNGSTSSDPEAHALTYAWTETADAGNNCTLSSGVVASPTVTILNKTSGYTCTYELVVNDGTNDSAADSMTITVSGDNDAPTANAGVDQNVNETDGTVNLDGSASSDPESQSLTYAWTETADAADACSIAGNTTATPTVTIADKASNYSCTYRLIVNDGTNNSAGDTMVINVTANSDAPTAHAGNDQNVNESDGTVNLDGSSSSDPEGSGLTYQWTETSDDDSGCSITGGTSATPTVTLANKAASYSCTYELVVNDGTNDSAADEMVINVTADDDAPTAHANIDQTVNDSVGTVNLNGSTSTDPENQSLTYAWTETDDAGNNCTLSADNVASPSVTILNKTTSYTCTYELVVNDGTSDSSADAMTINVTGDNDAPTANAGVDQNVAEEDGTVNLDGSASSDPEGQSLTYLWTETADASDACTLAGGTTATPTVTIADKLNSYTCTYRLVVNDGTNNSVADTMVISVATNNALPTANAGNDQTVNDSAGTVNLDGTASSDPEAQAMTYAWTETADAGNNCTLSSGSVASPTVTILNKTSGYTCSYQLIVNDGNSDSAGDSMTITVNGDNDVPTANAGSDQTPNESAASISLDGSASSDPENHSLTYNWVETSDNDDACSLQSTNVASPTLNLFNKTGSYSCTFSLTVNDGAQDSASDSVTISVTADNDAPTANAGIDQTVNDSAGTVNLNGTSSSDPESESLTYAWTETDDTGSNCTLSSGSVASPTVTILNKKVSYTCTYQLIVNDGTQDSVADSMTITVTGDDDAPTANAGIDQTVNDSDGTVSLTGSASSDPENDSLTYAWTETADTGNNCTLSGGTTATPSVAILNKTVSYTCTYQLIVNDGNSDSTGDSMTISVTGDDDAPTANAGVDQNVNDEAGSVSLSGTSSSDPEGQSLTYAWTETADAGNNCSLTDDTTATPSVSLNNGNTNYTCTFELVVNDGTNDSVADSMTITVTAVAGFTLTQSGGTTTVTEGGATDTYTIVLNALPTQDVVITVSGTAQASVNLSTLTFTNANWNTPQTITVTAVDDDSDETSPDTTSITHSVTSDDDNYDGLSLASVSVSVTDNDSAGVSIDESAGSTDITEGGATDSYTVVLTSQPSATVTVALSSSAQYTRSSASLSFTTVNWATPQTVTITAVDDSVMEGAHAPVISHTVSSSDTNYNNYAAGSVTVNITDNDTAGVSVTASLGTTELTEDGTTDTYTVVLTTEPTADVVITIVSTAEATANVSSLTFTSANWNTPQTVTLTAVNDDTIDVANTTITHTAASGDSNYNGISVGSIVASITDNDTANITLSESTLSIEEGSNDNYTVVLTAEPTADVVVAIADDSEEVTLSTSTLTFTSANWDTPQTVTATVANNDSVDGERTATITHTVTSDDSHYDGISVNDVAITASDDDEEQPEELDALIVGNKVAAASTTLTYAAHETSYSSYAWTVSGNASISGSATGSSVHLTFGSGNGEATLTLTVSDNEQTASESVVIYVHQAQVATNDTRMSRMEGTLASNVTGSGQYITENIASVDGHGDVFTLDFDTFSFFALSDEPVIYVYNADKTVLFIGDPSANNDTGIVYRIPVNEVSGNVEAWNLPDAVATLAGQAENNKFGYKIVPFDSKVAIHAPGLQIISIYSDDFDNFLSLVNEADDVPLDENIFINAEDISNDNEAELFVGRRYAGSDVDQMESNLGISITRKVTRTVDSILSGNVHIVGGTHSWSSDIDLDESDASLSSDNPVYSSDIGDFNGDGYNDIALTSMDACSTYVFFGEDSLTNQNTDDADVTILGNYCDGLFGYNTRMGEVNGDGYEDVVISVPTGGENGGGVIYVVFGYDNSSDTLVDLSDTESGKSLMIYSNSANSYLGAQALTLADTDNDGIFEIIMSEQTAFGTSTVVYSVTRNTAGTTSGGGGDHAGITFHAAGGGCALSLQDHNPQNFHFIFLIMLIALTAPRFVKRK